MPTTVNTPWDDTIATNQFRRLYARVNNVMNGSTLVSRRASQQGDDDKRRNLYEDCGYKQTEAITADDYLRTYERNPIAKKVVEIFQTTVGESARVSTKMRTQV